MAEKYTHAQQKLQDALLNSRYLPARLDAARNPNTPLEALIFAARHKPNEDRSVVAAAKATIFGLALRTLEDQPRITITYLLKLQDDSLNEGYDGSKYAAKDETENQFIVSNIKKMPNRFNDGLARTFTLSLTEGYESYYFRISISRHYGTDLVMDEARKMLEEKLKHPGDMDYIQLLSTAHDSDYDTMVIAAADVPDGRAVHIFRNVTFVGLKMYLKYEHAEPQDAYSHE